MNALVELNLALILFLPWYAILAVLFWRYPRAPRNLRRRAFDAATLLAAALATTFALHWSFAAAGTAHDGMWRQVLATSVSYGVFLDVMAVAWFARRRMFTPSLPESSP